MLTGPFSLLQEDLAGKQDGFSMLLPRACLTALIGRLLMKIDRARLGGGAPQTSDEYDEPTSLRVICEVAR